MSRDRLLWMLRQGVVSAGEVELSSGQTSRVYVDCRRVVCRAEAMPLVSEAFSQAFDRLGLQPASVGGLASGADPIALAIASGSVASRPIDMFSVRKERKTHGLRRTIEGAPHSPAFVVDDVATTGGSLIRALEVCLAARLHVVGVGVLVDRGEGALGRVSGWLTERGYRVPVFTIFQLGDLLGA